MTTEQQTHNKIDKIIAQEDANDMGVKIVDPVAFNDFRNRYENTKQAKFVNWFLIFVLLGALITFAVMQHFQVTHAIDVCTAQARDACLDAIKLIR